ncbi:DUF4349 domain-containing protein [Nostoc sp. LEGE 06077]|uniref:DUF4349 domain-containing protein n=1 Tax=Nostoc sp. LEGE 06077 TaxID=915325 RepID=UPI00187F2A9B|nr:DUF4349 domain-containing protein [Nostoc sp. LEGE 06077]MBE9210244.1 DUF4349 domain-containing protein [Nostoc sp. LEGE 06077]
MNFSLPLPRKSALFMSALLGGVVLTSCASAPQNLSSRSLPPSSAESQLANQPAADIAGNVAQKAEAAPVPRARPQLIKKAAMKVVVNSVEQSIDAVSQIIAKQQGDLIGLNERQPTKENSRHTASIQLRVPQNLLEPTLEELAKLGTIESRNITAEDVGDRLVDFQARLTNLRKTEANLQKIMDRAGSVRDVLSVAQELSQVRQSIEQIDAQLKNIQNQVAYSTITLNLEAAVSSTSPQRAVGSQIQETWNNSTQSLGRFTVGLLKLGIWLMVYTPYLLILTASVYGFLRWRRTHTPGETRN